MGGRDVDFGQIVVVEGNGSVVVTDWEVEEADMD